jgi:hypothetical protein
VNKKLVLSVLSTAVVTSMAASAMAKPNAGFYVGGNVDRYYSIDAFFNHFDEALDQILDNLDSTTFVDDQGKAAPFLVALEADDLSEVTEPARLDHFEKNPYTIVDGTGVYNPEEDEDLLAPDPGELKVESVSAINGTVTVTFDKELAEAPKAADLVIKKSIDGAAAVEVNEADADITLGADKKTVSVNVPAIEATDKAQSVVYSVSYKGGEEKAAAAFTVDAYALTVTGATVSNATTVELALNKSISAEDAYTFTFNGTAVDAANVAYGDKKVTLTVPAMADNAANTVVVADKDGNQVYSGTVTFDLHQPTTLTTDAPATTNAVVGEQVSLTFTLKDEDGDAIEGQQVRVRATSGSTINSEQTLTTDAQGKVTFTYTSIDGRTDTVEAVVLSKPTLRKSVSVEWVETASAIQVTNPTKDGFIVDTVSNVAAETQTIKYIAKFVDANGAALPDGTKVYVNLGGLTGTVTPGTNDEFLGTNIAGNLYQATLNNGDGTAVLEFTTDTAETITPTFYQDADQGVVTGLASFTAQDARLVAKSVEVVDGTTQTPTFTLALQEGATVNQKVKAVDGGYEVEQGNTVEYTLTAVDQYGNPFVGTANLSHKALLDNLAGNDTAKGSIQFDTSDDGAASYGNTDQSSIAFATVDADGDGKVEVQLSAGAAGDVTTPVVWVDKDSDGKLDADETKLEGAQVKFVPAVAPVVASMTSTADKTAVVGANPVTYTVNLKDARGNAYDASSLTSQNVVIKLYKDGQLVDQSAAGAAVVAAGSVGSGSGSQTGTDYVISGINTTGTFTFTVTPNAADKGSAFYPVVYIDLNNNGTVEEDETVSVQGPTFNAVAEPDHYAFTLDKTEVTAGETVTLTVTAYDSSNAVETDFDGEQIVEVLLAADTTSNAAPAKTYIRKANFVDGVATIAVPAQLVANDDILVTLPVGATSTTADFDADATAANDNDDNDLTITAAEASKLATNTSSADEIFLVDEFGNAVTDYNFSGIAVVSGDATFSGTVDAEGQIQVKVINGEFFENDGTTPLSVTGSAGETLTITLANGDTFTINF